MSKWGKRAFLFVSTLLIVACVNHAVLAGEGTNGLVKWRLLSSREGQIPAACSGKQQTACLVLDIDKNGVKDIVVAESTVSPAMVWLRRTKTGWERYIIEATKLSIEAGGTFADIDEDGDLDIVMGGDSSSAKVWWWENPYPDFEPGKPWVRREIKSVGANQHHDLLFADILGEKRPQLYFWNQRAQALLLARIPKDPRNVVPWPSETILTGVRGEGLASADMDGDGKPDLVAGGRWLKHTGDGKFSIHVIDVAQSLGRAVAGQLKEGGTPEVVFVLGDGVGPLKWYECNGDPAKTQDWTSHDLLTAPVDHGHSLQIVDVDGDGHQDVFCAEMRLDGKNPKSKTWIFYGDGKGNFRTTIVAEGFDNHESCAADLDGNGQPDILGKPYNYETPQLNVWLNDGR
jgi:hypothetical protein